jgi:hypothetical protein
MDELKETVARIFDHADLGPLPVDWSGRDAIWPAFERMALEGATVLVKIDGQRTGDDDNGLYTVLVSGGRLGDEFFRMDTPDLDVGCARAVIFYAENVWKFSGS